MYENNKAANLFEEHMFHGDENILKEPEISEPNFDFLQQNLSFDPSQSKTKLEEEIPEVEDRVFKKMKFQFSDDNDINMLPQPKYEEEEEDRARNKPKLSIFEKPFLFSNDVDYERKGRLKHGFHSQLKVKAIDYDKLAKKSSNIVRSKSHAFISPSSKLELGASKLKRKKKRKGKKSNSKNVFIQKIRELLSDNELMKKISVDNM